MQWNRGAPAIKRLLLFCPLLHKVISWRGVLIWLKRRSVWILLSLQRRWRESGAWFGVGWGGTRETGWSAGATAWVGGWEGGRRERDKVDPLFHISVPFSCTVFLLHTQLTLPFYRAHIRKHVHLFVIPHAITHHISTRILRNNKFVFWCECKIDRQRNKKWVLMSLTSWLIIGSEQFYSCCQMGRMTCQGHKLCVCHKLMLGVRLMAQFSFSTSPSQASVKVGCLTHVTQLYLTQ